VFDEPPLSFHP